MTLQHSHTHMPSIIVPFSSPLNSNFDLNKIKIGTLHIRGSVSNRRTIIYFQK
uniref:Uncharacterized protein n=1 Tax=Anguilla anguilla TaxID=7936 RepID=A0A0E9Y2G1_ANGAN